MLRTQIFLAMVTVIFIGIFASVSMAADKVVVVPLFTRSKIVAPVAKTGQTLIVPFAAPTGSDGALQKGTAWPTPRFTGNGDGTVTDNLTGLTWLQNANCTATVDGIDKSVNSGRLPWANALTWSNGLADGDCGLSDTSSAGDWRLPNEKELHSLIDKAFHHPALSNDAGTGKWADDATSAFSSVVSLYYWSSSSYASNTEYAWCVILDCGFVDPYRKMDDYYVWPVRD